MYSDHADALTPVSCSPKGPAGDINGNQVSSIHFTKASKFRVPRIEIEDRTVWEGGARLMEVRRQGVGVIFHGVPRGSSRDVKAAKSQEIRGSSSQGIKMYVVMSSLRY
jgi:hypothetical protein